MKKKGGYVSAQLMNLILAYAASGHLDMSPVLRKAGIEEDVLKNPNARIDMDKFLAVVSSVSMMAGGHLTGLDLAVKLHSVYNRNYILMTIMSNCPTLEKAIEKFVLYHDISSNSIVLRMGVRAGYAELVWESGNGEPSLLQSILLEAALTSCAILFRDFTRDKIRFREIHFTHAAPTDPHEYTRFFRCPVLFNRNKNKMMLPREDLSLPIALSDPELLGVLESYAQKLLYVGNTESALTAGIREILWEMILQGKDCQIRYVAEKRNVSIRTLQKLLQEENTTFRELLMQVKKQIALRYLESGETSLTDIAFLLGFSEQSAMNHAFRKWTGQSPKEFRRTQQTL